MQTDTEVLKYFFINVIDCDVFFLEKLIIGFVKIIFLLISITAFVVFGVMYNKLSYMDWPYFIAGIIFLILGLLVPI